MTCIKPCSKPRGTAKKKSALGGAVNKKGHTGGPVIDSEHGWRKRDAMKKKEPEWGESHKDTGGLKCWAKGILDQKVASVGFGGTMWQAAPQSIRGDYCCRCKEVGGRIHKDDSVTFSKCGPQSLRFLRRR